MDCKFRARAETDDDLWTKIADHAKKVHSMQNMDRGTMDKIQAAIKDA
jgi:predicted small metal-binding protein